MKKELTYLVVGLVAITFATTGFAENKRKGPGIKDRGASRSTSGGSSMKIEKNGPVPLQMEADSTDEISGASKKPEIMKDPATQGNGGVNRESVPNSITVDRSDKHRGSDPLQAPGPDPITVDRSDKHRPGRVLTNGSVPPPTVDRSDKHRPGGGGGPGGNSIATREELLQQSEVKGESVPNSLTPPLNSDKGE